MTVVLTPDLLRDVITGLDLYLDIVAGEDDDKEHQLAVLKERFEAECEHSEAVLRPH